MSMIWHPHPDYPPAHSEPAPMLQPDSIVLHHLVERYGVLAVEAKLHRIAEWLEVEARR